ncbi:uncharacterized protein BX664DRAFT_324378 [Halteromyces radiatus]|uniref:uncharacterized protein n=1 Tax=Halteromyces radiatus TaxID=101107 RepID=UPI00221EAFE9|nr:uncharacterized protein BX664DRAFT_324378 [Halteromyces radiatus]KAI8096609.1 hypothetical protein BX664DRAFT_324378 [Halteromyces radiatus]
MTISSKKNTDSGDSLKDRFDRLALEPTRAEVKKTAWTDNDRFKLEGLIPKFKLTNPPDKEVERFDWRRIGLLMNRTPGDCFAEYSKKYWVFEEIDKKESRRKGDLRSKEKWECAQYLSLLDAQSKSESWNETKIAEKMYPNDYKDKLERVRVAIDDICYQELDKLELFEGSTENDQDTSDDPFIGHLRIEHDTGTRDGYLDNFTPARIAFTKELKLTGKQVDRMKKIKWDWCYRCVGSMIKRDYHIYFDYYEANSKKRTAIIFGKTEPRVDAMIPRVIDAFLKSNDKCRYCGRKIKFWDKKCDDASAPTAASGDHFSPRKMAFNGGTKLQFICYQCNCAKSNAKDGDYRSYLGDIKQFHDNKTSIQRKNLNDEQKLEAWLMWMDFEYGKRYKGYYLDRHEDLKPIYTREIIKKVPEEWEMTERDKLYMEMVEKIGERDPRTGALGVYDHTMQKSNRFIITKWDWPEEEIIVTGVNLDRFKRSTNFHVTMKFTKDAAQKVGWEHMNDWINSVKANEQL